MKTLIIAPHVDDETIGCWSVLSNALDREVTIAWGYELTSERRNEALKAFAQKHTLIWGFGGMDESFLKHFDEIYIPSRSDWHADHKATNARFRRWATHFYSVDMQRGRYLGDFKSQHKRSALDRWFPSQRKLWEADAKYYLFEDIQVCDYTVMAKFNTSAGVVTMPEEHRSKVTSEIEFHSIKDADEMMTFILERVPYGKVTIETPTQIYEAEA